VVPVVGLDANEYRLPDAPPPVEPAVSREVVEHPLPEQTVVFDLPRPEERFEAVPQGEFEVVPPVVGGVFAEGRVVYHLSGEGGKPLHFPVVEIQAHVHGTGGEISLGRQLRFSALLDLHHGGVALRPVEGSFFYKPP